MCAVSLCSARSGRAEAMSNACRKMERLFFCSEIAASAQTERLAFCSMGDAHEPLISAMVSINVQACSQRMEVAARQLLSSMKSPQRASAIYSSSEAQEAVSDNHRPGTGYRWIPVHHDWPTPRTVACCLVCLHASTRLLRRASFRRKYLAHFFGIPQASALPSYARCALRDAAA